MLEPTRLILLILCVLGCDTLQCSLSRLVLRWSSPRGGDREICPRRFIWEVGEGPWLKRWELSQGLAHIACLVLAFWESL